MEQSPSFIAGSSPSEKRLTQRIGFTGLLPSAVVVFSDIVRVNHEGRDRITGFHSFAGLPLVVQFSDGLADGDRGLSTGTGDFAFRDQGLDVGRTVNAVDQGLGLSSFRSSGSTQSGGVISAEDGDSVRMGDQGVGTVQVALFLVAHAVLLEDHFKALAVNGFEEAVGAVHNRLHCGRIQHDDGAAVGQLGHQVLSDPA